MADVICLGELLIDFISTRRGCGLAGAPGFRKAPGGAPANVAVGLKRLGVSAGFIGKVGADEFGRFLYGVLAKAGVEVSHLYFERDALTTLAFVSLGADGEREFMFYRNPGADTLLTAAEIPADYLSSAKIFHFGSITLIAEPARSATLAAAKLASDAGLLVSYDPNLRLPLWQSAQAAREGILRGLPYAHLLKVSREELDFLARSPDDSTSGSRVVPGDEGARALLARYPGLQVVLVTEGAAGCTVVGRNWAVTVDGFDVEAVDTTGAGDAFVAGVLAMLLERTSTGSSSARERVRPSDQLTALSPADWTEIARFANAVGALAVTRKGAIPALPTRKRVRQLLKEEA
ncbi:MAG: PfkB family carbohydrate kinase [Betaproteobacteria bacterium]